MKLSEALKQGLKGKTTLGYELRGVPSSKILLLQAASHVVTKIDKDFISIDWYKIRTAFPILSLKFPYSCDCQLGDATLEDIIIHLDDIHRMNYSKIINYVKRLEDAHDQAISRIIESVKSL